MGPNLSKSWVLRVKIWVSMSKLCLSVQNLNQYLGCRVKIGLLSSEFKIKCQNFGYSRSKCVKLSGLHQNFGSKRTKFVQILVI